MGAAAVTLTWRYQTPDVGGHDCITKPPSDSEPVRPTSGGGQASLEGGGPELQLERQLHGSLLSAGPLGSLLSHVLATTVRTVGLLGGVNLGAPSPA